MSHPNDIRAAMQAIRRNAGAKRLEKPGMTVTISAPEPDADDEPDVEQQGVGHEGSESQGIPGGALPSHTADTGDEEIYANDGDPTVTLPGSHHAAFLGRRHRR
jgi:quercetin dioxygenase-like cupin family protein